MLATPAPTPLPHRPAARLTGRKVLAIFVVFFAVVAGANAVLVTSAYRTWSGLDEPSPYQASQRFNAELRRAREQDARGWQLDSAVVREDGTGAAVTVRLVDAGARPLPGQTLRARLERPTDKREDVAAVLAETTPGTYAARIDAVAPGQWDLVVEVTDDAGVSFRRRHRIVMN
jgi:nitrogen fixation protein FixH